MTIALSLLTVLVLLPSVAEAQAADDERAAEHFRLGNEYLADNRFEDALREFREAYALSGRVEMIYNEAVALEKLQRWSEAADAYERFARQAPDHPAAEDAGERAGEMRRRQAAEPETAMPEPVPFRSGDGLSPWTLPAIVVLGVSGLIGASSLVTGLIAHGRYTDLESQCPGDVCPAELLDDRDDGATFASVSTVLFVTSAIGAAAGTVFLILGLSGVGASDEAVQRASVEVFAVPGGAGVELGGRF